MNTISARIPKLSLATLELLTRRLRDKAERAAYAPPIRRRDPSVAHPPLSFAQQRLWFVEEIEPGNVALQHLAGVRMSGRLNVAMLERCLSEIVRRQEISANDFKNADGQPVQVISPPVNASPVVDLGDLSESARAGAGKHSKNNFVSRD